MAPHLPAVFLKDVICDPFPVIWKKGNSPAQIYTCISVQTLNLYPQNFIS